MKIGSIEIDLWSTPGTTGAGPAAVDTERMIEVPLGLWFLEKFPEAVEVGAVTPYYLEALKQEPKHQVLDPYDPWPGCIRKRAEEIQYVGIDLLSISTIEHIDCSVALLMRMCEARHYLITWAAHQQPALDNFAETLPVQCYSESLPTAIKLHRDGYSHWIERASLRESYYGFVGGGGKGPFPFGNGVYVVTNLIELLQE